MKRCVHEKKRFRYRAKVELIVASLDQYGRLQRRPAPGARGADPPRDRAPQKFGQYDYWLVMYQTGKIPEAKLKPIFDEQQWGFVNRQLNQGEGWNSSQRQPRGSSRVAGGFSARTTSRRRAAEC